MEICNFFKSHKMYHFRGNLRKNVESLEVFFTKKRVGTTRLDVGPQPTSSFRSGMRHDK